MLDDKVVQVACYKIDIAIIESDCEECVFEECMCPTCERLADCTMVCGAVRWDRKYKNDVPALIEKLREFGNREDEIGAISNIAAEVLEELTAAAALAAGEGEQK